MLRKLSCCVVSWLAVIGCGGDDTSSQGGSGLLSQAPHCPAMTNALKIQGTLDGSSIEDIRSTNINAGYVNFGQAYFATPFVELATLADGQVGLRLEWLNAPIAHGETTPASSGFVTAPSNHPRAGEKLCVTSGQIGFVQGGEEDGAFKFAVTGARTGADCTGSDLAVDLRGCYQ